MAEPTSTADRYLADRARAAEAMQAEADRVFTPGCLAAVTNTVDVLAATVADLISQVREETTRAHTEQTRALEAEVARLAQLAEHRGQRAARADSLERALREDREEADAQLRELEAERDEALAARDSALAALRRDTVATDIHVQDVITDAIAATGYVWPDQDPEDAPPGDLVQAIAAAVRPALAKATQERNAALDRVKDLEGQLAEARREAARESTLVSEARHERDTAQKEARTARREAAALITGDRSDALHWAARQLRKTPMPTALTGPYWYGQGWKDAIDHLEDALAGAPTDAQVEIAEQAATIDRLQTLADRRWVAWHSARRRASQQRDALREALAVDRDQVRRVRDRYRDERNAARARVAELEGLLDIEQHNHTSERNLRRAQADEIAGLRAQLAAAGSEDVHRIDIYEQGYADVAATLEAAADARAPISVTTCSNNVTTYLPVRLDGDRLAAVEAMQDATTRPHRAVKRLAADAQPTAGGER